MRGLLDEDAASSPAAAPSPPAGEPATTHDLVHFTSISTGLLVFLVITWSLAGHRLSKRYIFITEGNAACLLGFITGLVLLVFHKWVNWGIIEQLLEFNAAGFFTYLLPPVIFYCGLSVEKQHFFTNLPSIISFGVFGTVLCFIIISVFIFSFLGFQVQMKDCLAMGAIFAATDSVAVLQVLNRSTNPLLFSLVFGEGIVNDATSVVLLGAIARAGAAAGAVVGSFFYLLVTSMALGGGAGLLIAFVLKRATLGAHQELAVVSLLGYLSYLVADALGLSGILSLFTCAILVSHYAMHNISAEGFTTTMNAFRTLSYLSEGMIFIYVGMDALDPLKWKSAYAVQVLWLSLVLTVLLPLARAASLIPFALLHNLWASERLSSRDVIIIWFSGLMRGAVSVALVYLFFDDNPKEMVDRQRSTLIVTTLLLVLVSILGYGALSKPMVALMLRDNEKRTLMEQLEQIRTIPLLLRRDVSHGSFSNGDEGSAFSAGGAHTPNGTLRYQAPALQHRGGAADGIEEASALLGEGRGPASSGRPPPGSVPAGAAAAAAPGSPRGLGRAGSGAGRLGKQLGSWWSEFDGTIMRPLFGGPGPGPEGQGPGEGSTRRGSGSPARRGGATPT